MKKALCLIAITVIAITGCSNSNMDIEPNKQTQANTKVPETEIETYLDTENDMPETRSEEKLRKESEENLKLCKDMVDEIQADYPSIRVASITNDDDGKNMSIYVQLSDNESSTLYEISEFTVKKETLMNDYNIIDITVFVEHNEEVLGLIMFENRSGVYEPIMNTL